MELTFDELVSLAITVYGIIATVVIFSDQIARLLYYLAWRQRQAGGGK